MGALMLDSLQRRYDKRDELDNFTFCDLQLLYAHSVSHQPALLSLLMFYLPVIISVIFFTRKIKTSLFVCAPNIYEFVRIAPYFVHIGMSKSQMVVNS